MQYLNKIASSIHPIRTFPPTSSHPIKFTVPSHYYIFTNQLPPDQTLCTILSLHCHQLALIQSNPLYHLTTIFSSTGSHPIKFIVPSHNYILINQLSPNQIHCTNPSLYYHQPALLQSNPHHWSSSMTHLIDWMDIVGSTVKYSPTCIICTIFVCFP